MNEEKLSQDKRPSLSPVLIKTIIEKITFPVNNQRKKITLFFVLFFSFLAQSDLNNLLLDIPDFNKLTVNEGEIKIHKGQGRVHDAFALVINNHEMLFSCGISECLPINKTHDYQGNTAKVWWYKSNKVGLIGGENRLFQLEINGDVILSYEKQTKNYLFAKNFCLCINLVFFIISVLFFFLLQIANERMAT